MADTHRTHLAQDDYRRRANTRRRLRTMVERDGKPAKAARKANRSAMREARKEYR